MEMLQNNIQWFLANYQTIGTAILTIVGGFSVIAKLTPTPADDAALAKIVKVLDFLAFNKQR